MDNGRQSERVETRPMHPTLSCPAYGAPEAHPGHRFDNSVTFARPLAFARPSARPRVVLLPSHTSTWRIRALGDGRQLRQRERESLGPAW